MAVFRIEKTRDYTVMSNHHLRDMSLSLKAKGLLSLMLSLPENWDYTMKGLARICKDGIDSISGGIRELEEHGYLIRERVRGANGQLGSIEYTILEQPKEPTPAQEKPIQENPIQANPTLVTPVQEEPAQLNKDKSSNDPSRTDLSSTEVSNPIQSNPPTPAGARMGTDGMGARESYRELILENSHNHWLYWGVPDPFGRDCNTDCQNAADAPVLVLSDVRRHRFKNCRDGSCAVPAPLNIELYLKGNTA